MTTYPIDQMPAIMAAEIRAKQAEVDALPPWWKNAKVLGAVALAILGAIGAFYSLYMTPFSPFLYAASLGVLCAGAMLAKKYLDEGTEKRKFLEEMKECQKDLAGTAFPQFIRIYGSQFTLPTAMKYHQLFAQGRGITL